MDYWLIGSISSFAYERECKIKGGVYSNIDSSYERAARKIQVRYLGASTLELEQSVFEGFNFSEDLHLMALSQSVESNTGGEFKRYEPYESFKVSFDSRKKINGHTIRLEMYEDKKFRLFLENNDGNYIQAYAGKCKNKISIDQAKSMSKAIREANSNL